MLKDPIHLLLYSCIDSESFGCNNYVTAIQKISTTNSKKEVTLKDITQRQILVTVPSLNLSTLSLPTVANALKERNEALCGTGFFTNIAQYMCTEIGNIADEGSSKGLSSSQDGTVDSLMSKLMIPDSEKKLNESPTSQSNLTPKDNNSNEEIRKKIKSYFFNLKRSSNSS
mmetsp:Transcript_42591/g.51131  ORF Transcript_42591/g.51131 Transcript_42591/m.51131 type:complete len:171 (-) Transcript_42591:39-551(-)